MFLDRGGVLPVWCAALGGRIRVLDAACRGWLARAIGLTFGCQYHHTHGVGGEYGSEKDFSACSRCDVRVYGFVCVFCLLT